MSTTATRSETATHAAPGAHAASPAAAASHWQEYAIEAALLGKFMMSACLFTVLLFHPAFCLVYSGWGKQSGAHFNPAVTLTFARLGRIAPRDAVAYVVAQFAGAVLGVLAAMLLAGPLVADASVRYAVTVPGPAGRGVAFAAEILISFILMTVVLAISSHRRLGRFTGLCAGLLVATFISLEAPLSGMSMNPARTVGSAVWAHDWTALWIYFAAPLLGMLGAAELHLQHRGRDPDACAKLHHQNAKRCIFCEYRMAPGTSRGPAAL